MRKLASKKVYRFRGRPGTKETPGLVGSQEGVRGEVNLPLGGRKKEERKICGKKERKKERRVEEREVFYTP